MMSKVRKYNGLVLNGRYNAFFEKKETMNMYMAHNMRLLLIAVTIINIISVCSPASSNDFALNDGAFGLIPLDVSLDKEAPVRLVEEYLVFRFGKEYTHVEATFIFENPQSYPVFELISGFPDIGIGEDTEAWYRMYDQRGALTNAWSGMEYMHTLINGQIVESTLRFGYVRATAASPWLWVAADDTSGQRVGWHVVKLTIPPKHKLQLERRYKTRNGRDGVIGGHFFYITLTGGPWLGPIEKLSARVILEDGLTVEDLDWDAAVSPEVQMSPPKLQWLIESPKLMRLCWKQFEPMTDSTKHEIVLVWRPEGILENTHVPIDRLRSENK